MERRALSSTLIVIVAIICVSRNIEGQEIAPLRIEGQAGENVTINCTSARPNEAENNRLQVYIAATDVIELLDGDPRLNRVSDMGALTIYMFGPLVASDNGTIVSCTASQINSPNATIIVISDMMTSNGMMVTTTLEPQQTGTTDNTSTSKAVVVSGVYTAIGVLVMLLFSLFV